MTQPTPELSDAERAELDAYRAAHVCVADCRRPNHHIAFVGRKGLDAVVAAREAAARQAGREEVVARVEALVRSPESDRYRLEACTHIVEQPYADNRYVRLLDAGRALVAEFRAPDATSEAVDR